VAEHPPLRIGFLPTFYHTSHLLRQSGWHPAGGSVEWTLAMTGPALVRLLGDHRLDLAYIGLPPAMIAIARGVPIVCVAGGHEEGTVLTGAPDLPTTAEDGTGLRTTLDALTGASVGIPAAGSIHDVIFRELLREHGREGTIEIRNFPQADLITEALAAGELRAGVGTPALAAAARRYAGARLVVPARALWPHNPSYGVVATPAARERAEALREFLVAHEEATALIRGHPAEAARRTAESVEVADAALIEDSYRISPRYCAALSEGFVAATHRFADVLLRLGYLPRAIDPAEVFDDGPIRAAHPGDPHYDDGIAAEPSGSA
jgi:NitT/TauT family transport system substrate-binding protein